MQRPYATLAAMLFITLTFSVSTATVKNPPPRESSAIDLVDRWLTDYCASLSENAKYDIALQQCIVISYPDVNVCEDFLHLPEYDRHACEAEVEKANK